MHFPRRFEQQINQRGMQFGSRNEFHRRSDQINIVSRDVFSKIKGAFRQFQFVQIVDASRITIRLRKTKKLDVRCVQELPHVLGGRGIAH